MPKTNESKSSQVRSKKRVADHGEVFTAEREVNGMLDLVKHETERIDSRFLEPACGSGNFLVEILKRKLDVVKKKYRRSQTEYERYAVIAVSSIYGVDIMEDNVEDCRLRLYKIFDKQYKSLYKTKSRDETRKVVEHVLKKNIIWGDALTMLDNNGRPIKFSEWSAIKGSMFKRRDYTLSQLIEERPLEGKNYFSDLDKTVFIPNPVMEYPLIHFMRLPEYD